MAGTHQTEGPSALIPFNGGLSKKENKGRSKLCFPQQPPRHQVLSAQVVPGLDAVSLLVVNPPLP